MSVRSSANAFRMCLISEAVSEPSMGASKPGPAEALAELMTSMKNMTKRSGLTVQPWRTPLRTGTSLVVKSFVLMCMVVWE
jgi:hypothetical protein